MWQLTRISSGRFFRTADPALADDAKPAHRDGSCKPQKAASPKKSQRCARDVRRKVTSPSLIKATSFHRLIGSRNISTCHWTVTWFFRRARPFWKGGDPNIIRDTPPWPRCALSRPCSPNGYADPSTTVVGQMSLVKFDDPNPKRDALLESGTQEGFRCLIEQPDPNRPRRAKQGRPSRWASHVSGDRVVSLWS